MLPAGFLQDLLARVDIVEVVGRHVTLRRAGIHHKGLCPFHGEKTPSFTVSPSRQTYHCFGCGAHGDAIRFLTEHTGAGFMDAVRELAGQVGLTVPDDRASADDRARAAAEKARQATLGEVLQRAADHYRQALKGSPRAIDYLKRRGLTGRIAAQFGLGYAPEGWRTLAGVFPRYDDPLLVESGLVIASGEADEDPAAAKRYDRFRDRIMFPIRSVRGEVIGFGGRVLDGGEPKYLNSPETPVFHKGRELYGLHEARTAIRKAGHALVVEGYMDVVALAQHGIGQAVATLGTACTDEHVAKLFRFTDAVVFSFDGDAAGRRAALRAMEASLPHVGDVRSVRFLFLPAEHDPDSFVRAHGAEAFQAAIAAALPLSEQLLAAAAEGCDLDTPEGRARMLSQARPWIEAMSEGLLRSQLIDALAERGRLPTDTLLRHWQASAGDARSRRAGGARVADGGEPGSPDSGPPPWGAEAGPRGPQRGRGGDGGGFARPWSRIPNGRRPTPQTATRLDRAAWLLARHADRWAEWPEPLHAWLCAQPAPHGPFFAALERVLHEQGPMTLSALLEAVSRDAWAQLGGADRASDHEREIQGDLQSDLQGDQDRKPARLAPGDPRDPRAPAASASGPSGRDSGAALQALVRRILGFDALDRDPPATDLDAVLRQLELAEIDDELRLLTQGSDGAGVDAAQLRALYARKRDLQAQAAAATQPSG